MQTLQEEIVQLHIIFKKKHKAYRKVIQARVKTERQSAAGKKCPDGTGKKSKETARLKNKASKVHKESTQKEVWNVRHKVRMRTH